MGDFSDLYDYDPADHDAEEVVLSGVREIRETDKARLVQKANGARAWFPKKAAWLEGGDTLVYWDWFNPQWTKPVNVDDDFDVL